MLGKTNAVSGGKQKYGAYNIDEVEVDGGVVLEITDADEKPVDKLQLRIDNGGAQYLFYNNTANDAEMAEMLEGLDTSNATTMFKMFGDCTDLTSLDLSTFNTSKVMDMGRVFENCYNLTNIDLSSFNTSNVADMNGMFYSCRNLTALNLSNFNTSNATSIGAMFYGCNNLTSLDLSSFNTENVTSVGSMFAYCNNLTSLDISSFNTANVTNMGYIFASAYKLTAIQGTLDLYTANAVTNMFNYTYVLTGVTLKNIRMSLQIGSGTRYGHLWELPYLINAVKELWDLSSGSQQTLTIGSANLEKIANTYVKLITPTAEQIEADPYINNKLPCDVCESTDEGAMTLTAYAGLKNWGLA